MWGVVLSLLCALVVGFLIGGGPVLWLSLVVGLAVFGGDPGDPLAAVIATATSLAVLGGVRAQFADRMRR